MQVIYKLEKLKLSITNDTSNDTMKFWMQVEPDGELLVEPLCILEQRETMLQRRSITEAKVQWKHCSLNEATWGSK